MANLAFKVISNYFEGEGLKHIPDEENSVITVMFSGENVDTIKTRIICDDDSERIHLRTFNFISFPASKVDKMYQVCSRMNKRFMWVKFYVDEEDNTITVEDDAIIALDTAGDEAEELCLRMIKICDDAYPEFMKALWA